MDNLKAFRADKDNFFARHHQSPLTPEQKRHFTGLEYFPKNGALRLEVDVEASQSSETVTTQTTGGQPQTYQRFVDSSFSLMGSLLNSPFTKTRTDSFCRSLTRWPAKKPTPRGVTLSQRNSPTENFL